MDSRRILPKYLTNEIYSITVYHNTEFHITGINEILRLKKEPECPRSSLTIILHLTECPLSLWSANKGYMNGWSKRCWSLFHLEPGNLDFVCRPNANFQKPSA